MESIQYIDRTFLDEIVSKKNGKLLLPSGKQSNDYLPANLPIILRCHNNHQFNTTASNCNDWCLICNLEKIPGIKCIAQNYSSILDINFICDKGHIFKIEELKMAHKGCRVCNLQTRMNKLINSNTLVINKCTLTNKYSKIRVKCNTCNAEFYVTESIIKMMKINKITHQPLMTLHSLLCKYNHWVTMGTLHFTMTVIHAFEILFHSKFDDIVENIEFTGYNNTAKIAYICQTDKYAYDNTFRAKNWCVENAVTLIEISKELIWCPHKKIHIYKKQNEKNYITEKDIIYEICCKILQSSYILPTDITNELIKMHKNLNNVYKSLLTYILSEIEISKLSENFDIRSKIAYLWLYIINRRKELQKKNLRFYIFD
jgi:hypothetical protein